MKTFLEVFPWVTIAANLACLGFQLWSLRSLARSRRRFDESAADFDQAGQHIARFLAARAFEMLMLEPEEEEGPHYDS